MFEPTTQRITATLTEWHGTHGKALGDDGNIYDLHQDPSTGDKLQNGNRIEIYLDLDEQAQIANLTFNPIPYIQRGESLLHQIQGEKFYFQPAKLKKQFWRNLDTYLLMIVILLVGFFSTSWYPPLIFIPMILILVGVEWYGFKQNHDETDNLVFIFNETGLLIAVFAIVDKGAIYHHRHRFQDFGVVFIEWDDVIMIEENEKGYLRCVINRWLIKRSSYYDNDDLLEKYKRQGKYKVRLDIRTDLLPKDEQIRLENAIQHEITRRGKVFR